MMLFIIGFVVGFVMCLWMCASWYNKYERSIAGQQSKN